METETKLAAGMPRYDLIVLPLISLLTIILLPICGELGVRLAWPEQKDDLCLVAEPGQGFRGRPNCVSWTKTAEGPWVENHYNDCGLRSPVPCQARNPGLNLVAIGSSITSGYLVPYKDSWLARTAASLGKACGEAVTIQNYAGLMNLNQSAVRAREAAATNAQAAIMFITAGDLFETPSRDVDAQQAPDSATLSKTPEPTDAKLDLGTLRAASRAIGLIKYFLVKYSDSFVDLYLRNGDRADYLRLPFTPAWQGRLATFDLNLGSIAGQLRARNIPLLIVYSPPEAQSILLSGVSRAGVDPHAIITAIADIARRHGVKFVDASPRFSSAPAILNNYYISDGHANANGHALLSKTVEDGMTGGPDPLLDNCRIQ